MGLLWLERVRSWGGCSLLGSGPQNTRPYTTAGKKQAPRARLKALVTDLTPGPARPQKEPPQSSGPSSHVLPTMWWCTGPGRLLAEEAQREARTGSTGRAPKAGIPGQHRQRQTGARGRGRACSAAQRSGHGPSVWRAVPRPRQWCAFKGRNRRWSAGRPSPAPRGGGQGRGQRGLPDPSAGLFGVTPRPPRSQPLTPPRHSGRTWRLCAASSGVLPLASPGSALWLRAALPRPGCR